MKLNCTFKNAQQRNKSDKIDGFMLSDTVIGDIFFTAVTAVATSDFMKYQYHRILER